MAFIDVFADDPSDIGSLQLNFKGLDGYSHMYLTGAVNWSIDLQKGPRFPLNDDLSNCYKSMWNALSSLIVSLSAEYEVLYNYDWVCDERSSLEYNSLEKLMYTSAVLRLASNPSRYFPERALNDGTNDSPYIKEVYFGCSLNDRLREFLQFGDHLQNLQTEQFNTSHSLRCNCILCTGGIDGSQDEMTHYSENPNFVKGMSKRQLNRVLYGLNGTYRIILEDNSIWSHKFYEELHYNRLVNARILQANGLRTLSMPPILGEKRLVSSFLTKVQGLSSGRVKFVSGFLMGGFAFAVFANAKTRAHV